MSFWLYTCHHDKILITNFYAHLNRWFRWAFLVTYCLAYLSLSVCLSICLWTFPFFSNLYSKTTLPNLIKFGSKHPCGNENISYWNEVLNPDKKSDNFKTVKVWFVSSIKNLLTKILNCDPRTHTWPKMFQSFNIDA